MIWKKTLSLTLFKIITVSRSNTLLKVFLMGRSGCSTKRGIFFFGGGILPTSQKVWTFPFYLISLQRKISLIALREILPKILPEECIFNEKIINCLQKVVEIKFLNAKQCAAGLSPRIIPHYHLNISGKTSGWGRQNLLILPNIKIPLTKFTSSAISKVQFLSHEIVIFM